MVVDDSAFMRKVIGDLVAGIPGVRVVGFARNGKQAIEQCELLRPDLILMDVEMPIMTGLEALKLIKQRYDITVMMLSALTNREVTIEALELGAADFIEKPVNIMVIDQEWRADFKAKVQMVYQKRRLDASSASSPTVSVKLAPKPQLHTLRAIVIGASTGGPKELLQLIRSLPRTMRVPILIVQHMPKGFTTSFAQRMDSEAAVHVVEATEGMTVQGGTVYLSPGDYHLTVAQGTLHLNQEPKLHGTRPAVDYLFKSAAKEYGQHLAAIILTGMGSDGAAGMQAIQQHGGYTIAQDKATSVVFGMPRSAIELGAIHDVLSLDDIETKLQNMVN